MTSSDFRTRPIDDRGNLVAQNGALDHRATVSFSGRHNRLVVDGDVKLDRVTIRFRGDNGQVVIGAVEPGTHLSLDITVAEGAKVEIGAGVTSEKTLTVVTASGANVNIGAGCHIGTNVSVVADDSRGLGRLSGDSRHDVVVGERVWIMRGAEIRSGASIGNGSVLEMTPIVDEELPAGQLVRGLPATPVRPVFWDRETLEASR